MQTLILPLYSIMEGKAVSDPRRLAYQEYMQSKDKARYTALAQKLAQHINHLAEDKNTRIRWIWQLIQNAKDVPNQFGKCRIRIQIMDDRFIFAHNGDPFRVSDLQSLVAQYSSKGEENKVNIETTGKYGTGFIVTYILSKKIRIKGLLTMKTHQEQLVTKRGQDQDEDNMILSTEDQIFSTNLSRTAKSQSTFDQKDYELTLQDTIGIGEHVQSLMPKKSKLKSFQGGSLYQRFDIFLDRQYKDRDRQLFHKLMTSQKSLMDNLLKNQPQPKWQRKQGQLNTQFIYEELDEPAHKMINQAMLGLKQLFPYALLFNPKLFQIQVIDKRSNKSLKKFGIKRIDQEKFNGLKIFNAKILEEGQQKAKTFSLAYTEDQDTYSTIAIPLQIKQNSRRLLEINNNYPKIFKQFPLIGCRDTGFNFAFTSKRFYPNQARSALLLEYTQGRDNSKAQANWQSLIAIFEKGLQLYKLVFRMIDEGQQNLLIVSMQNQFNQGVQQGCYKRMSQIYKKYKEEIAELMCVRFRDNSQGTLKQLTFPYGKSQAKQTDNQKYSQQLNAAFAIVLGHKTTLSDRNYARYFPKITRYYNTWKEQIRVPDVKQCLSQLSKLTFEHILFKVDNNRQSALLILQKVYEFLSHHHPHEFLSHHHPLYLTNQVTQQLRFVLTNKQQFKEINQSLMVKSPLFLGAYQEIGQQLGIDINHFTIFDRFAKYFPKIPHFGVIQMLKLFENFFFVATADSTPQRLILLGRLINTFQIKTQALDMALKLKYFEDVNKAFAVKNKATILPLAKQVQKQFQLLFELKIINYVSNLIEESQNLANLIKKTIFSAQQKQKAIQWLNIVFKVEKSLIIQSKSPEFAKGFAVVHPKKQIPTRLLTKNLTMTQKFKQLQHIKCFCYKVGQLYYKGNFPNSRDFQICNNMRLIEKGLRPTNNSSYSNDQLQEQVLHQSIQYKLPTATTYQQEFSFINSLYNDYSEKYNRKTSLTQNDKIQILDYVSKLREAAAQDKKLLYKCQTFKELQSKAYFEYPALTKCIKQPEHQVFAFALMKSQEEIEAAKKIKEKFGSLKEAFKQLEIMEELIEERG